MNLIPISSIIVEDRQRKDYGDLESLKQSLETYGLIQPIVLNAENRLIAGGRRLQSAIELGWESIPYVYKETLSEDHLTELELEENLRRKDMSWQEQARSIAKIHKLRRKREIEEGRPASGWGMRQTGELLGYCAAHISWTTRVTDLLDAGDKEIEAAPSFTEATKIIIRRAEDEALKRLASSVSSMPQDRLDALPALLTLPENKSPACGNLIDKAGPPSAPSPRPIAYSLNPYRNVDCLKFLQEYTKAFPEGFCDHIITDPPYAIDMDNLDQENLGTNVDRTKAEHDELENIDLLHKFIPLAYSAIREKGFLVMWCDPMNFRWLHDLCEAAGFAVQRWPIVWHKLSPCSNGAAAYNTTKNIEFVLLARKKGSTLSSTMSTSVIESATLMGKKDHPFEKPKEPWMELIKLVSYTGQLIFDPFAGVGSCVIPALEMGRRVMSCEKVSIHHAIQIERVKAYFTRCDPNAQLLA